MALTDLKRKFTQSDRSHLSDMSVDEFIDDALNYAIGDPKVVSIHRSTDTSNKILDNSVFSGLENKPYRRSTFTLSEPVIAKLAQLSNHSGKAKSKIVRELITRQYEKKLAANS